MSSNSIVAYLIDEFGDHAASANAASRMLSNVMDFTVALSAPQLYKHLSYGWGNSLLAMLSIAIGWPAIVLLWKWEYSCGPLGGRIEIGSTKCFVRLRMMSLK
jgi:hypothetical protein